jgi:FkbM family methyltransferase
MHSDKQLLDIFIEMQKEIKPTLSIEVGAFDADYSKAISKLGIECYAFEASPFVYEKFKDKMEGISYINKAVSDKDGVIQFELMPDHNPANRGNNSIKSRNENLKYKYIDIDSITLNSYFADRTNEIISLWIDCEGANRDVLLGATNILPSVSSILIETEDVEFWKDQWLHKDVVKFLSTYGFEVVEERFAYVNQKNTIFKKF